MGCLLGHFAEADLPEQTRTYTDVSYFLSHIELRTGRFTTCKAEIRRQLKIQEIARRKAEKVERKRQELEEMKKENPAIIYDEEMYFGKFLYFSYNGMVKKLFFYFKHITLFFKLILRVQKL